jgi:hypothetical protein
MTKKIVFKSKTILTNLSPNMNPFTQNNPYPLYSLTKLSVFCSIGNVKWKATNFISTTKKGAMCNYNATIMHFAKKIQNI